MTWNTKKGKSEILESEETRGRAFKLAHRELNQVKACFSSIELKWPQHLHSAYLFLLCPKLGDDSLRNSSRES